MKSSFPRPQKNHLSGLRRKLLKVIFYNSNQLNDMKREVVGIVAKNKAKSAAATAYAALQAPAEGAAAKVGGERCLILSCRASFRSTEL